MLNKATTILPEFPEKTSRYRVENRQIQPTFDAGSGNRTRDTLVGGECSHHCVIPATHMTLWLCNSFFLVLFFFCFVCSSTIILKRLPFQILDMQLSSWGSKDQRFHDPLYNPQEHITYRMLFYETITSNRKPNFSLYKSFAGAWNSVSCIPCMTHQLPH